MGSHRLRTMSEQIKRRKISGDQTDLAVTSLQARDIRFHTSKDSSGSDARSSDPEYSTVYVVLTTSDPTIQGIGLAFTLGRGTEIVLASVQALQRAVGGTTLEELRADFGSVWRRITTDGQLVWLGPDKGPVHQA